MWLLAVMPTVLPARTSAQIMRAPVCVLPAPGRSLDREDAAGERGRDPQGRIQRRFTGMTDRLSAEPWRRSQQQIPCGLIGTVAFDAVRGDIFAEPEERLGKHLRIDHRVRIDGVGMKRRGVLALLDVDPALVERDRVDLAEFVTAAIAQVFVAAQFGFLRRKGIAMDRRLRRAADSADIFQTRETGAFVKQVVGRRAREPEMLPPQGLFFPAMPIQSIARAASAPVVPASAPGYRRARPP